MQFPPSAGSRRRGAAGRAVAIALSACGLSPTLRAHELLLRYELPVPFSTYLSACAITLVITFGLFGWLMRARFAATVTAGPEANIERPATTLKVLPLALLRGGAAACLGLTILAGLGGTPDPDRNVAPTLFWQVFLLGLLYATAFAGDLFALLNPWRQMAVFVWGPKHETGKAAYPIGIGYWPAVVFYVGLTWLELFNQPNPRTLGLLLVGYSLVTLAGTWVFGSTAWFRYADGFSVLFRVIGLLAPICYRESPDRRSASVHLRWPFAAVVEQRADHISLVVFVLALLSSTTYDGIHQTVFWMGLFWTHLLPYFHPHWQVHLESTQAGWESLFNIYQRLGLMFAPAFYLAVYLAVLQLTRILTKTRLHVSQMALAFIFSVLPIALVYNCAHNYTLILTRAYVLPYLFSDPLGLGWNPLALPHLGDPPTLDMRYVWHAEVFLILVGHVISVYLAHLVALQLFETKRDAVLSQIPMLMLMLSYTMLGLWVISLPFALT